MNIYSFVWQKKRSDQSYQFALTKTMKLLSFEKAVTIQSKKLSFKVKLCECYGNACKNL